MMMNYISDLIMVIASAYAARVGGSNPRILMSLVEKKTGNHIVTSTEKAKAPLCYARRYYEYTSQPYIVEAFTLLTSFLSSGALFAI